MTRIEHDFIGDLEVPANAYYGVQSLRGKENFFITEEKNNQEIYNKPPLIAMRGIGLFL